ncbi:MAG: hypothetical protein HYZ25_20075 [Chloroflexi bacterium]|nr:hypothetical protein [Chloroflexota bacterium]
MNKEDKEKKYVVDESGVIINSELINEESQSDLHERLSSVSLPYRKKTVRNTTSASKALQSIKNNKIPGSNKKHHRKTNGSFLNKRELGQDKLAKCPFCEHKTEYSVLFVHLQVSHPEMNPKIVMAAYNQVHRNNGEEITKYKIALDKLVIDYEVIKKNSHNNTPRDK